MSYRILIKPILGRQNRGHLRAYVECEVDGWFTPHQARRLAERLLQRADMADEMWKIHRAKREEKP